MTPSVQAQARKNLTALLHGLGLVSQERAAELAGIDPTKLSKWKQPTGDDGRSELERFTALAAACGYQMVRCTDKVVDPKRLAALAVLARDQVDEMAQESGWGQL